MGKIDDEERGIAIAGGIARDALGDG